ncbi:MAG: nucleotide exchange factor GrpE [Clostridiales bacterium]|nr:nucleotide exchange factor GrpE [Clostridiales bacterium]
MEKEKGDVQNQKLEDDNLDNEIHNNLRDEEVNEQEDAIEHDTEIYENELDVENNSDEENVENNEYYDRLLRLQAEFANYKKRVEREKADIYSYANEKLATDLLDILDNLERALDSQDDSNKDNALYEGIELVLKQLKETLKKHGVEEIEAMGQTFDMNLHHAVMSEAVDGVESNQITEVFQKGYTLNGRVLRPSMVKVAQ